MCTKIVARFKNGFSEIQSFEEAPVGMGTYSRSRFPPLFTFYYNFHPDLSRLKWYTFLFAFVGNIIFYGVRAFAYIIN